MKARLHEIIFEAETRSGKIFDVMLIICILLSVMVVMMESVRSLRTEYGDLFFILEWGFTLLFTIEYGLRIYCIGRPTKYIFGFFGIIDLVSILPSYIDLLVPGTHFLIVFRIMRVIRIFRVLKLVQYLGELQILISAFRSARRKATVFLVILLTLVTALGAVMYLVEGEENGFTSIPRSIYWAIVTLTTVGYGDLSPTTDLGQTLAAISMIVGYAIIAVPAGIATVEITNAVKKANTQSCPECSEEGHDNDAVYCKYCGEKL